MISPKVFLLFSGVLALAAASNSFYPYSYYQNFYQQPYQNYYQYQQPSQNFYQYQHSYPNFYQNQGFYNYPRIVFPNINHFGGSPVTDRLGWGTVGTVAAGVLGPLIGNLIGGN